MGRWTGREASDRSVESSGKCGSEEESQLSWEWKTETHYSKWIFKETWCNAKEI